MKAIVYLKVLRNTLSTIYYKIYIQVKCLEESLAHSKYSIDDINITAKCGYFEGNRVEKSF